MLLRLLMIRVNTVDGSVCSLRFYNNCAHVLAFSLAWVLFSWMQVPKGVDKGRTFLV